MTLRGSRPRPVRAGVASIGIYDDTAALGAANDVLWSVLAEHLTSRGLDAALVPRALDRRPSASTSDRALFAQVSALDLAREPDRFVLLGTPIYDVPGFTGVEHRGFVVVHAREESVALDRFRGRRAVIDDDGSFVGRYLLGDAIASLPSEPEHGPDWGGKRRSASRFFEELHVSGSVRASLERIAEHAADIAAIDCVAYATLARDEPSLVAETRVLQWTRPSPAPPFVLAASFDEARAGVVRSALAGALADPRTAAARHALRLVGIRVTQPEL